MEIVVFMGSVMARVVDLVKGRLAILAIDDVMPVYVDEFEVGAIATQDYPILTTIGADRAVFAAFELFEMQPRVTWIFHEDPQSFLNLLPRILRQGLIRALKARGGGQLQSC